MDSGDQKHQRPMVLLLVNCHAMLNDVFNEVNSFWSLKPIIKRSLSPIAVKIVMQDFYIFLIPLIAIAIIFLFPCTFRHKPLPLSVWVSGFIKVATLDV